MPQRGLQVPYYPTSPPDEFDDWPRWMDDELRRISEALKVNPPLVAINGTTTVAVDTTPTFTTLGLGDTPILDVPGGGWDVGLAQWTAPEAGIYIVSAGASVSAYGSGNKDYGAALVLFKNSLEILRRGYGGADNIPLGLALNGPIRMQQGDVLLLRMEIEHEQFTGNSTVNYNFSYLKSASV